MSTKNNRASAKNARAQHVAIDINKIRRWQYLYSQGKLSKKQQKAVKEALEKERSVANRRMKRFSDTGQTSPAYQRALGRIQQATGSAARSDAFGLTGSENDLFVSLMGKAGSKFGVTATTAGKSARVRKTWGKAKDFEELLMSAGNVNAFVRSEQSTLTGAKLYRKQKIREFRENPKFSTFAGKYSDKQIEGILEMLHDDNLSDYFDYFADYSEEIEKIAGIMEEESGEKWLRGKLEQYGEYIAETQRLDTPFHNKGVTARELKALINTKYQQKAHRRRR